MGIVVRLFLEPRSIQTSGNSLARGHLGHGTHHMGFHLTCPEGRFRAPWLPESYCARPTARRLPLRLRRAGRPKDNNAGRCPGIPRSERCSRERVRVGLHCGPRFAGSDLGSAPRAGTKSHCTPPRTPALQTPPRGWL